MTNRNRIEIISQILHVATDYDEGFGVRQNTIRYRGFLNTSHLKKYLLLLTTYGLLSYESSKRRFRITDKGLRFLEIYDNLGNMTKEEVEEEVDYVQLPRM